MKKDDHTWLNTPKALLRKTDIPDLPFQKKRISKFITVDGRKLALAGSMLEEERNDQFFSAFYVIDHSGHEVTDKKIQETIHRYAAFLSLGVHFKRLRNVLSDQERNEAAGTEELANLLTENDVESRSAERLSERINPFLVRKLEQINEAYDQLYTEEVIHENNIRTLIEDVNDFWSSYEDRLPHLNTLAEAGIRFDQIHDPEVKNMVMSMSEENRMKNLALSSFTVWFQEMSTTDSSLESVIKRHFSILHKDKADVSNCRLSGLEKTLLIMIKVLKPIMYFIVIPLSLLIFIGTGFNFGVLIFPAVFWLVYRPIFNQSNKYLKYKVYYRFLESNQHLDPKTGAHDSLTHDDDKTEPEEGAFTPVTFKVTSLNRGHVFYYAFGIFFIVTTFVTLRDGLNGLTMFFFLLSFFFGLVGLIILKSPLSKTEITFQEHFFLESKGELLPAEFKTVNWNEEKNLLRLDKHDKNKFRYILEINQKDKIPAVEKWAEMKGIEFNRID
ncbi:hypothetical protein JSY36_08255 [Bacillus sp. H-16]|uniref:hypothetical protein n=1 Tax=Alteribacter salitolerans TaxID=2912333 RepID=UPI0019642619|nr:hypothetical protein [Alteribacter salitolerans]MBM7095743.1 hypothetical protein [Alteribacter salitolerans]